MFTRKKIASPVSHFKLKLILLGFLVVIIFFSYIYLAFLKDNWYGKDNQVSGDYKKEYIYFDKLDGQGVETKENETPQVVAVMIDNHTDARPQSGLSQAKIIYEVPVEGNITRLMAIFDANQVVENLGPVRSARPYFLDWASEYGESLYLHCGGSPEALTELKTNKLFDINEFYWGSYFWRAQNKIAPHNVYTSSTNWQEIINSKNYQNKEEWLGWKFAENLATTSTEKIKQINVAYSNYYEVSWRFNEFTNRFDYYQNGKIFTGEDDNNLSVENVLVQYVQTEIIDSYGRLDIKTVGGGEARVLRAGEIIHANWEKKDRNSRTRFFDNNGQEINLIPGRTWVQVVPTIITAEVVN